MDDFNKKYEEALEELTEAELEQVANLNQKQLEEWVNSPTKIRPFLLKKWRESGKLTIDKLSEQFSNIGKKLKEVDENMAKSVNKLAKNINKKSKYFNN